MLSSDPAVQATVLGVRKGDPGADRMDNFSPTDGDWPRVIRVNPILAWEYSHVWRFIRALSLPYPSLYDQAVTVLYSINSEQDFLKSFREAIKIRKDEKLMEISVIFLAFLDEDHFFTNRK